MSKRIIHIDDKSASNYIRNKLLFQQDSNFKVEEYEFYTYDEDFNLITHPYYIAENNRMIIIVNYIK